jgi:glutamate racemase
MSDSRPIGVFDSGIGGLTVLRALLEALPRENYVYLGDTARVPYGTKGAATIERFAAEAMRELLSRDVKSIVVACNTASALALESLQRDSPVPVHGVIEPGVEAALRVTRGHVGVIGTLATIGSGRYEEALRLGHPEIAVLNKACPLFVPLAEEGWVEGSVPQQIAEHYLHELREAGVDSLILGCTHYPILKNIIAAVMGDGVHLVDSAVVLADAVARGLASNGSANGQSASGTLSLLVSDVPQRFAQLSQRFLGRELPEVELVDLESQVAG